MRFYSTPGFIRRLYPELEWNIKTGKKEIFLTFDDGPTPELTNWILAELEKFNAKATFFCVGENLARYPSLAGEIRKQGHIIANHTYNHLNGWKTVDAVYFDNIEKCELLTNNKLFRPPYGKIKRRQAKFLHRLGYRIIMWDLLTYDFDASLNKEKTLRKIIKNTRPGSVIVFHDNIKAEENIWFLLPETLAHFAGSGYLFSSL